MYEDDKYVIEAVNYIIKTQEEEYQIIRRLLWYLNSAGRRRWIVKERPDRIDRSIPRADFTCEEQKTGAKITVEISYVSSSKSGKKLQMQENLLFLAASDISHSIQKRIKIPTRGIYISKENLCYDPRDLQKVRNTVEKFVKEFNSGRLSTFDKVFDAGFFILYPSPKILDYWNNDYVDGNYGELKNQIQKAINEADIKLSNCSGEGVLVLFLDLEDLEEMDIFDSFINKPTQNIKRFYVLSKMNSCLRRIW